MEKKKLKLSVSVSSKKTISSIEQAKTKSKNLASLNEIELSQEIFSPRYWRLCRVL